MKKIHRRAEKVERALNLRYSQGMSYNEVSKAMGIPASTIKSWVKQLVREEDKGSPELSNATKPSCQTTANGELRPIKIEIVSRRKEGVDKDAKAAIRELQMQVALLRDFLSQKGRR